MTLRYAPLLVLLLGGCGDSGLGRPASVRGQVLFQGRPLPGGVVVFAPNRDRGNPGRTVFSKTDVNGFYALGRDASTDVAAGWYRVAIAPPADLNLEASGYPPFPAALRQPDRSGIEREVSAGRENVIDLHVTVGP